MASNAPARSPSVSPPSSPTTTAAQPTSPSSVAASPSGGHQSRTTTAQSVAAQPNNASRQNTVSGTQAATRASTAQAFQTTNGRLNGTTQARPVARGRASSRSKYLTRLHDAFSPSTHNLKEHDALAQGTSRPYLHKQQRKRLWLMTVTEFLVTLILCVTYFLILYLYHLSDAIDKKHRRIFNALVTGNALFLGINLSASLKSYVKMLRWNILASRYRPLKMFDLILGCDSVTNVVKLFWHGRNKKHPFGINFFASKTSLLALMWLIIQLGIAVCVGIIGLTYNLDISPNYVFTQQGNTSIIDLPSISTGLYLRDLSSINDWATQGLSLFGVTIPSSLSYDDSTGYSYITNGKGYSRYWFFDRNPTKDQELDKSRRYIDCNVTCTRSVVTSGQYGLQDSISYADANGNSQTQALYELPGQGGLYAVADTNSSCGDRCTNIVLFQAGIRPEDTDTYLDQYGVTMSQGTRFSCEVVVTDVQSSYVYFYPDWSAYEISPLISRMIAGMFGWSDNPLKEERYLYQRYAVARNFGFGSTPDKSTMQNYVSTVTTSGIAAMDDQDGLARKYVQHGRQPIEAQVLHVKWWAAGALLGAIPVVQLVVWAAVIATANRVIIKDDSALSMAKVYWTLLKDNLGENGCMLDNDQLIEEVGVNKVVYGYREGTSASSLKHVDIFEEGRGCDPARSFPEGDYDGQGQVRKRHKQDRKIDAREYF